MSKPRLLDLFCKAGGATAGYQRAGFHVTGVDIEPQPHYCGDAFIQADALTAPLDGYDVIHASPPCQAHVKGYRGLNRSLGRVDDHRDLIPAVRMCLVQSGRLWVIENVVSAPLENTMTLCGTMFGLRVLRHRRFESNVLLLAPWFCQHDGGVRDGTYVGVYGNAHSVHERHSHRSQAMGIDWMTPAELSQAIPPAYTEYIGRQLIAALSREDMAV